MPLEQRPEVDSTSSSPFIANTSPVSLRDAAAYRIPPPRPRRSGSPAQTGSTPSPARPLELFLLPAEAAGDDALDAGVPQPPDLPCEERPAADGHERLRATAAGGVAEALRLAAGEDDRLHSSRVPFEARPIAA